VVNLVNKLEQEKLAGSAASLASRLANIDFVVLDDGVSAVFPGWRQLAVPSGQYT
jgi:hypothetical protein